MITINDCLNFKHKYEIAPDAGQCPVNALPRDILHHILSYLWIGMRANEVCKGWNEYFIEVLNQDLVVWNTLARVLKWDDDLPASRSSLVVRKQDLTRRDFKKEDWEFYEWFFEYAIQSSFFENVFAIARIEQKVDEVIHDCYFCEYQEIVFEAVQLNALDTALDLLRLKGWWMRRDVAIALGIKWVYAGNGNRALAHAKDCDEETKLEIAKAFIQIGDYTNSVKVSELCSDNETKADILLANAESLIRLSEIEKSYEIALKIQRIIRSHPSVISCDFANQCNKILKEISIAFSKKGDMNRALDISQMMRGNKKKSYILPY